MPTCQLAKTIYANALKERQAKKKSIISKVKF